MYVSLISTVYIIDLIMMKFFWKNNPYLSSYYFTLSPLLQRGDRLHSQIMTIIDVRFWRLQSVRTKIIKIFLMTVDS